MQWLACLLGGYTSDMIALLTVCVWVWVCGVYVLQLKREWRSCYRMLMLSWCS